MPGRDASTPKSSQKARTNLVHRGIRWHPCNGTCRPKTLKWAKAIPWLILEAQIGIDRSLFLWRLSLQLVLGDILLLVVLFHLPPVFKLLGNLAAGPNPSQDGFPLDPGQIEPWEFILFVQQPCFGFRA